MGTQKIEIGDIFEVPTAIGNAYIQYMAEGIKKIIELKWQNLTIK